MAANSTPVPQAIRNWLKSQYPHAPIRENWLAGVAADGQSQGLSSAALVQHVKKALLDTPLSASLNRGVLPTEATSTKSLILGDKASGPVLLEIVSKLDIGVSAQTQLDVLEARRQARMVPGGTAQLDADAKDATAARSDGSPEAQQNQDHMAQFNAAEEAASLPATVFPRSTLQLVLSDGFTEIKAFEHRRIAALSMTSPPLGSKILVKNVQVRSGQMMLSPECIEIKGGRVESLDSDWENAMIDDLRKKLSKPTVAKRTPAAATLASSTVISAAAGAIPATSGGSDRASSAAKRRTLVEAIDAEMEAYVDDEDEAALFEELHDGDVANSAGRNASRTHKRPNDSGQAASNPTNSRSKDAEQKRLKLPPKARARPADQREVSPIRQAATPSTIVTSPYFARSSSPTKSVVVKRDDEGREEEDDEVYMYDVNDLANPIVLSDSD